MTDKPARIGRPPEPVPQDIADAVVEWIAEGKPLREFCRQPGMPARRTVDDWRLKDEAFAARVARARDVGYAQIADECLAIVDTSDAKDDQDVARRKLRVETRLKLLACWDPRRYGNKVAVGGDADAPPIRMLSDGERERRISALLFAVRGRIAGGADTVDDVRGLLE